MTTRGLEVLQLTDQIVEKIENALRDDRTLSVDDLYVMFRQSLDLCYTKPPHKLSNIGICPRGGWQNSRQTNTSLMDWRQGKSF